MCFCFCIAWRLKVMGRSKFGVGGAFAGRTVWRVADHLEKTLLCTFLFLWSNFLKLHTYICWFSVKYNIEP